MNLSQQNEQMREKSRDLDTTLLIEDRYKILSRLMTDEQRKNLYRNMRHKANLKLAKLFGVGAGLFSKAKSRPLTEGDITKLLVDRQLAVDNQDALEKIRPYLDGSRVFEYGRYDYDDGYWYSCVEHLIFKFVRHTDGQGNTLYRLMRTEYRSRY